MIKCKVYTAIIMEGCYRMIRKREERDLVSETDVQRYCEEMARKYSRGLKSVIVETTDETGQSVDHIM